MDNGSDLFKCPSEPRQCNRVSMNNTTDFIIYSCAFPTATGKNVVSEKGIKPRKKLTSDHFSLCTKLPFFSSEATYCNTDRSLEVNINRITFNFNRLLHRYTFTPGETSANHCDSPRTQRGGKKTSHWFAWCRDHTTMQLHCGSGGLPDGLLLFVCVSECLTYVGSTFKLRSVTPHFTGAQQSALGNLKWWAIGSPPHVLTCGMLSGLPASP